MYRNRTAVKGEWPAMVALGEVNHLVNLHPFPIPQFTRATLTPVRSFVAYRPDWPFRKEGGWGLERLRD